MSKVIEGSETICKNPHCAESFPTVKHTNGKYQEYCSRECQSEAATRFMPTHEYIWDIATKEIQKEWDEREEQSRCCAADRIIHVMFNPTASKPDSYGAGKRHRNDLHSHNYTG